MSSWQHAFTGDIEEGFMRTANDLEKIESQIMNLPVSEQIHLIERIARRVRSVQTKSGIALSGEGFQVREGAALYSTPSQKLAGCMV